ncbi:pectinesterase-like [Typha latifolia]|uniref:pectinesterase-like n=1 Tax=Typha latifolia TaxID=4733 RepID=UPI003C2C2FEA
MLHLTQRTTFFSSTFIIALLLFLLITTKPTSATKSNYIYHVNSTAAAAASHCNGTLYPDLCATTLSSLSVDLTQTPLVDVICASVNATAAVVRSSVAKCSSFLRLRRYLHHRDLLAVTDCLELFDHTLDFLRAAEIDVSANSPSHVSYVQTVLSAAITNQYTCLDGFAFVSGGSKVRPYIEQRLTRVSRLVSNSLALVNKLQRHRHQPRREVFEGYGDVSGGFPRWLSAGDRRILQSPPSAIKADVVVAKDGSGKFTTIGAAVAAAPSKSARRFVIYIKAGAYFENVEVGKSMTNIMFIGDGIGKTVIKAGRNVVDGWTTFRSATVAVVGNGFIARDITIENSAGPSKFQAVALRTGADLSAFYRCSFVGYQDTLYVHSLRQFYRECNIYGTIDFIFGNAAVVFQKCNLYARKPLPNQMNVFTAQGREDPNQNTGISIQNCKVTAASDLIPVQSSFSTYLGRPWKQYSRTVYMQSLLDSLIHPKGWLEWDGTFGLSTLYYGEYKNRGLGSNTSKRVNWEGFHVISGVAEASKFTVGSFIQGDQWLGPSQIPFSAGLN